MTDTTEMFQGTVVVIAPHMDDGVLGCGGTIARLSQKERIHLVYATDGSQSPAPLLPWLDSMSTDLGATRMRETRAALRVLDISHENVHFLGFPEGRLSRNSEHLKRFLVNIIERIKPDHVMTPFRFDRHPDHLAVNRLTTGVLKLLGFEGCLIEYFVYYRWRLLPERDIRKYIAPDHLIEMDIKTQSNTKRRALECFKSQVTRFYPWQHRPVLSKALLDEVCENPEFFLKYNGAFPGTAIFTKNANWIRLAHRLEPFLKKQKDRTTEFLHWMKNHNEKEPK